jgi:hypothetical protein
MKTISTKGKLATAIALAAVLMSVSAYAADRIEGRVEEAGGAAIAGAEVTLWLAGPGAPEKLAEAKTHDDGSYDLALADGRNLRNTGHSAEATPPAAMAENRS